MEFQTMDVLDGCTNAVVSPEAMLKLCQLRKAFCEAVTFSCEPFCVAVAEPDATLMPVGFDKPFIAGIEIKIPTAMFRKMELQFDVRIKNPFQKFNPDCGQRGLQFRDK